MVMKEEKKERKRIVKELEKKEKKEKYPKTRELRFYYIQETNNNQKKPITF